jgi:hypothetical protein
MNYTVGLIRNLPNLILFMLLLKEFTGLDLAAISERDLLSLMGL